jgi:iron complex outermembrane recepter protein
MSKRSSIPLMILCAAFALSPSDAESQPLDPSKLADMSIEELTKVTVTSASKYEQSLVGTSSAIFVVSQKDIRRSTATSFPELLRMIPGLFVARVDAKTWAVTARGFGGVFANKLLVLIDNRTVYTPLFSGTYWEVQDYPLEDIERIEVIRGPGGTLWGSNAVNGVINIITKGAKDTQGVLASISSGNETHGIGNVRYGFTSGDTSARIYSRGRVIDDFVRDSGGSADDRFTSVQTGFKVDHSVTDRSTLTVQGDIYSINGSERLQLPLLRSPFSEEKGRTSHVRGGNILTRLEGDGIGSGDRAHVQAYFDRANRDELVADTSVSTYDIEGQYEFAQMGAHRVIFGTGVRLINDAAGLNQLATLTPDSRDYTLANGFVQDEFTIIPDELTATAGLKFEHNDFTGGVWQPSVRANWHPTDRFALWGAVSRAVRIPSRVDSGVRVPAGLIPPGDATPLPTLLELQGSSAAESEVVISYEAGVRSRISPSLAIDSAAFFSDYSDLRTFERGTPDIRSIDGFPGAVQPLVAANNGKAYSVGIENVMDWTPSPGARVQLWHSVHVIRTELINDSTDFFLVNNENNNPVHQVGVRGQFDLPYRLEFNPFIRFVDTISVRNVDSNVEADLQLAWKPSDRLRVALNVTGLLHDHNLEYRPEILSRPSAEVERSFYFSVLYQY